MYVFTCRSFRSKRDFSLNIEPIEVLKFCRLALVYYYFQTEIKLFYR